MHRKSYYDYCSVVVSIQIVLYLKLDIIYHTFSTPMHGQAQYIQKHLPLFLFFIHTLKLGLGVVLSPQTVDGMTPTLGSKVRAGREKSLNYGMTHSAHSRAAECTVQSL